MKNKHSEEGRRPRGNRACTGKSSNDSIPGLREGEVERDRTQKSLLLKQHMRMKLTKGVDEYQQSLVFQN